MAIWFKEYTLEEIARWSQNTLLQHIDIRFTEIGENYLRGTMPVDHRTKQPVGLLHGGASVVLAESLASTAANLVVNPTDFYCVGLEINANHVGSCTEGLVVGTATAAHIGRTTQVWQTEIRQKDRLVCLSRMTIAVLQKKK